MIIDSFLFFQELDLLEIRLEYLYEIVDKFIIVEAGQSFKGNSKDYNFENNIKRYSKYLDKIYYYKIPDKHTEIRELLNYIKNSKNKELNKIYDFIKSHNHYDKNNLSHILDTYHRECIHIALEANCKIKDTVIISDLDEIPKFNVVNNLRYKSLIKPVVLIQKEFQFYFNNYSNNFWNGSIIAPYKYIKNKSLNKMRLDSKKFKCIEKAGYHFTSLGNLNCIKNKIENYAHQEYNNSFVKNKIEKNILHGKDIFFRFGRKDNICIKNNKNNFIDAKLFEILSKYKSYFLKNSVSSKVYDIKYIIYQIIFNLYRVFINPQKVYLKFYKFLNKNDPS